MSGPTPKQIELFSQRSAKKYSAEVTKLVPIALELALAAGRTGITVSDLRVEAEKRGINTYNGNFLGSVMRAAKLVRIDEWRRSEIDQAHGNLNRVHVHPDFAPCGGRRVIESARYGE